MTSKACRGCGEVKPLEGFYPHPMMADGHLNYCKVCYRSKVKANYAAKRSKKSAYEKSRNQTPGRRARRRQYDRAHRDRHPERAKARRAVNNAVRDKRLIRLPCRCCGNPKSQAHHPDYSRPLDVLWECFKCHREKEHGQIVVSDYQGPTGAT